MKIFSLILSPLLAVCICTGVHAEKYALAEHPLVAPNLRLLEIWIKAQMAYHGIPGISVGIVHDQELVYARGFGYADVEKKIPARPSTVYRIASHTKLFTSIAIMQLRDAGKLSLDDPVSKHLPWFTVKYAGLDAPPVTIRHLLTHTAGIPREARYGYWVDYDFPTKEKLIEYTSRLNAVYPAETTFKYSNYALAMAGAVVAAVSGMSYDEYIQKNILAPLGMYSTGTVLPEKARALTAAGYGRRMPDGTRAAIPPIDARGMNPATGISSSVVDMAKFISWQLRLLRSEETGVLKSSTLKEMQRPHWIHPGWRTAFGLGFYIIHRDNRDLIGHNGGYPGFITSSFFSPSEKIGVIAYTNSLEWRTGPGWDYSIIDRVFDWVAPAIAAAVKGEKGTIPPAEWRKVEGTYRSVWGDAHVLWLDGKMKLVYPGWLNPKNGALTLEPVAKNAFRLEGFSFGEIGEILTFEEGSDGTITGLELSDGLHQRIDYDIPME